MKKKKESTCKKPQIHATDLHQRLTGFVIVILMLFLAFPVNGSTIEKSLDKIFSGTNVNYTVKGRQIVLTTPEANLFEMSSSNQQQKSVSGKVTDSSGSPLPGVSVVVKGTTTGVITDMDGKYTLAKVPQNSTLQFSFVGMKGQEIVVGNKTTINMVLEEETVGIEEVVAVGYGTQKKRDVAGAISSVQGTELSKSGSGNAVQALSGRTAGVYVSTASGKPGAGTSVRIRGIGGVNNSEPLYVVDGIQGSSISNINPNDIESMEVLKDAASSAIYGSRGANGIVLITTKKGSKGIKIDFNGSYGVQNMVNSGNIRLLDAQEYASMMNLSYTNSGLVAPFGANTAQYPSKYFPSPSEIGKGTDWLDLCTNSNAPMQEYGLSVSSGNDVSKVFLSFGYLNQDGIQINTGYDRYTFRINSDHKINKWLSLGNNTSFTYSSQKGPLYSESGIYTDFYYIYTAAPTLAGYNADGSYAGPPSPFYAPQRNIIPKLESYTNVIKNNSISNNLYIQFALGKNFRIRSEFVTQVYNNKSDKYYNNIHNEGISSGATTELSASTGEGLYWMSSNTINYDNSFKDHRINILAGYEVSEGSSSGIYGVATYKDPTIQVVGNNGAVTSSLNQTKVESSSLSQFGRITYNYKSKYYFTGNIRRDGSSKFGANSHFGVFPSFSGAWRLSGENFFPKNVLINDFKIRGSYGEVGNDNIGDYAFLAPVGSVYYSMSGQDGSFNNGLAIASISNPDLKWETSKQMNFGVDLVMFDNKLSIAADYFKTDVTDMLLGISIPTTSGISDSWWGRYSSLITNLGALTNKGFEFDVKYQGKIRNLSYRLNANLTTFNNEVTDIGPNEFLAGSERDFMTRTYVGGSLGDFYGYVCEGIFQTKAEVDAANALDGKAETYYQYKETQPGNFKFKDLNGDNVINDKDRQTIGSPIPDFTYGFGLDLTYKQFSLSALFNGTSGNQVYNENRSKNYEINANSNNRASSVLNAWNGEGTSNTIPKRFAFDNNIDSRTSTAYLEDASFFRLRNIVFSYSLPKTICDKFSCANASAFISGDNLLTFSKYQGFDPEVSINYNSNNLISGYDHSFYPHSSIVRLGFKLTF